MFKEILQIQPRVSSTDLAALDRSLSTRFGKIAKSFGKGLLGAIKGGGIVGLATSLIDKLLNPLQETREAMDRAFGVADDATTNAEQFGSTPGELFKLQKMAQAKGLEADGLNQLLVKFQGAVAEAAQDPNKQTSVRNFANDTDMVSAFYEFIQSLNKMDRKQQILVQQEVFGEKQTLKMAEFMRADFDQLQKAMKLRAAAEYDKPLNKLDALGDRAGELKAGREANDVFAKGRLITQDMVDSRAKADTVELQRENDRIANYKSLQTISETSTKILKVGEDLLVGLGNLITTVTPAVNKAVEYIGEIAKSPLVRGVRGGLKSLFGGG